MRLIVRLAVMVAGTGFFVFSNALVSEEFIYRSTAGVCFSVNDKFLPQIDSSIAELNKEISEARRAGKYIAYLSVPISNRGGGFFDVNNEIAEHTAAYLAKTYGERLHIVNPAKLNLKKVDDDRAGGGEYMAIWSDILAGADGLGSQFDIVYFAGPADVDRYFRLDAKDKLGALEKWVALRMKDDESFARHMSKDENRYDFVRYYGLRASATFSKGANDEWNIVSALNEQREAGQDISVFFNGGAVEPGDYSDLSSRGYTIYCK